MTLLYIITQIIQVYKSVATVELTALKDNGNNTFSLDFPKIQIQMAAMPANIAVGTVIKMTLAIQAGISVV